MSNYKKSLPRSYYNIIILLLILLTLFSAVRLIHSRQGFNSNHSQESYQIEAQNLEEDEKKDSNMSIKIIQHMFPNREMHKQYEPLFSVREIFSSFFSTIFKIDFKNPLTFVQAQFPVVIAHHDTLMAGVPVNENNPKEEEEEDWSREIHFVDYNNEEKTVTVDAGIDSEYIIDKEKIKDEEDLREIEEGIYVIGEDDIVDSLNPLSEDAVKNIPRPKSIAIEEDQPSILIYHTHGTESYSPAKEGNFHSLKKEYTVIAVADIMKEELEKRGYKVIHDETYHDYPSYNGSYGRSVVTAQKILEENPSIKVVLDIHRDGFDNIDTRADRFSLIENYRVKVNGEYAARFMPVIGGKTENKEEVEKFAHFIKRISDDKYPGICKEPLVNQYGKYNQYLSDYATLIEIGSNTNTIEEAKRAGYYLADVLADALDLLKE